MSTVGSVCKSVNQSEHLSKSIVNKLLCGNIFTESGAE